MGLGFLNELRGGATVREDDFLQIRCIDGASNAVKTDQLISNALVSKAMVTPSIHSARG